MDIVYSEYVRQLPAMRPRTRGKLPMYIFSKKSEFVAHLKEAGVNEILGDAIYIHREPKKGFAGYWVKENWSEFLRQKKFKKNSEFIGGFTVGLHDYFSVRESIAEIGSGSFKPNLSTVHFSHSL